MKKQNVITKTLIHAAVLLIATAVAPAASAQGTKDFGDLDNDGLDDIVEVTSPTRISVWLANFDGTYTLSATLTIPKNQTIAAVYVGDQNWDGVLDVYATSPAKSGSYYYFEWLGNGDGTFGSGTSIKSVWPPKGRIHGWW